MQNHFSIKSGIGTNSNDFKCSLNVMKKKKNYKISA